MNSIDLTKKAGEPRCPRWISSYKTPALLLIYSNLVKFLSVKKEIVMFLHIHIFFYCIGGTKF